MADCLQIGLTFQLTSYTGWGIVGLNIALELAARDDVELSFWSADFQGIHALDLELLRPAAERCRQQLGEAHATGKPVAFDGILIHAEGNACSGVDRNSIVRADRNVGLMVFEDTHLTADKISRLKTYDWLVTASRWNRDVLLKAGLPNVLIPQGIDPTIFHPAPKSGRWRDRFVVFSGGKLEYRKGQDIVLAAFREFQSRHPDALLVTAWQNKWPMLVKDMTLNQHVTVAPVVTSDGVDVEGWFHDNGLPDGSAIDLGIVPNAFLGQIMREADVAVFASRAEGGTNLMAMEAMASGVPTITSQNTGHLDLPNVLGTPHDGRPRQPTKFFDGIEGWGETRPDQCCAMLELAYGQRGMMAQCADEMSAALRPQTWRQHTDELVNLLREKQ